MPCSRRERGVMTVRYVIACLGGIIAAMMTSPAMPAPAGTGLTAQPPTFPINRADEDYRYLVDQTRRTDLWDPIKYVPVNEAGTWYLSFGGEARERFEYFNHPNWGQDPQDHGYFLQRYFLHGDLHMGEHA